ncbi:hypothetical protein SEA_CASSITA_116 [Microbacterium phage Cassita]|nr:hypothetical protein SEA_CASSITA_116 [Microbacterium phage Cassita]
MTIEITYAYRDDNKKQIRYAFSNGYRASAVKVTGVDFWEVEVYTNPYDSYIAEGLMDDWELMEFVWGLESQ